MHHLKKLLDSGVLSDVSFSVGEEQEIFKAHKCILAVRSPVFLAMFDGNFKESSTSEEEETRIHLPDSTPVAFKEFLKYIYLEKILLNEENWAPILYLADKYDLPQLKKMSVEFVRKDCYRYNAIGFYSKARRHCVLSHVDLIKYIIGNECTFFQSQNNEILSEIISLDELYCYEIHIFRSAIFWASSKIPGEKKDGTELRRILGPALFAIRFPRISALEFENEVIPSGILSEQEIINILYKRHHLYEGFKINFPSHSRIECCICTERLNTILFSKHCSIKFEVDKKLKVYGYRVECFFVEGKIKLKSGKEILREENIVHHYSPSDDYTDFYFDSPVIIEPHTPYTASLKFNSAIENMKFYPPNQIESKGVKWTFSDTNPEEGSIYGIFFSPLE